MFKQPFHHHLDNFISFPLIPRAPLTHFNGGGGGGPSDFFGSEILAKSDFFGSMIYAGIFLGRVIKTEVCFLGCEKRTKGFFWECKKM